MILKLAVKTVLAIHVFFYRLTKGIIGGSIRGTPVLLLTTSGRKSGKNRTLPLGYVKVGQGFFLLMASNGGARSNPGWYYNLKNDPQAMIEIKGDKMVVQVEEVEGDERVRLWQKFMDAAPIYKTYEKTNREIPLIALYVSRQIGKNRTLPPGYNEDTQRNLWM